MAFSPGNTVGRYELLYLAGRGGMGDVWCARTRGKHGFERLVAVKTLVSGLAEDPAFRRMFMDEARLASGIEHENVARVLDVGDDDRRECDRPRRECDPVPYLVMEWVAGESLSKLLRFLRERAPCGPVAAAPSDLVPLPILLRIVADACAGLHAAHELASATGDALGLVHRDVSPANIMVSVGGTAKLIDFGIAKAGGSEGRTQTGVLKGTVRFMSPEQVEHEALDRRSDVWSMGVVLYHLLTGAYPHRAEADGKVLVALALGQPIEPLPDAIPAPLRRVVERALRFDREERTPSALALRKEILAAMSACGMHATVDDVAAFLATSLEERVVAHRDLLAQADVFLEEMPTRWGPSVALLTESPLAPTAGTQLLSPHLRAPTTERVPRPMARGGNAMGLRKSSPGPRARLSWAFASAAVACAAAAGLSASLLSYAGTTTMRPTGAPDHRVVLLTAASPLRSARTPASPPAIPFSALPAASPPGPVTVAAATALRPHDSGARAPRPDPRKSLERAMDHR